MLDTPSKDKWESIGTKKRAGVLVPLFSVYSRDSLAIGELGDLNLLIDWAAQAGNSILQLLPMNETGSLFCPYDALSSFALEPVYLSLRLVPGAEQRHIQERIEELKKDFPAGMPYVNYGIRQAKLQLLQEIYLETGSESQDFEKFKADNAYWLSDFAIFKALRNYHQAKPWYEWAPQYRERRSLDRESIKEQFAKEITFQAWLQWQLYHQFKKAKEYAAGNQVLLKGDLPLLVSKDSADVWAHPEFFKLDFASGAPPDMYCARGQRWGMPPYAWDKIAAGDYRYLKEKLGYAQNFYDIIRIDHAVGLFRIWSIPDQEPLENQGLHGAFDPADEKEWGQQGRALLSVMLENSQTLICAEDLGLVPPVCTETLRELGLPGNEVQRWAKDWAVRHDFINYNEYRLLSVAMLSTHDTTNWVAWWENEAGTVDEHLFIRKCDERGIDYSSVKEKLFDLNLSRQGRMRWLEGIKSVELLAGLLGRKKAEVMDFIALYQNTYHEKEKLWKHLGIGGQMAENQGSQIIAFALKLTLDSRSIFCINTIIDWLYLSDIFKADACEYRFNTPGTISNKNWSLVIPISLEQLLRHTSCADIRAMIESSGRV